MRWKVCTCPALMIGLLSGALCRESQRPKHRLKFLPGRGETCGVRECCKKLIDHDRDRAGPRLP